MEWWKDYSKVLGLAMFAAGLTLILTGFEEYGVPMLTAATGIAIGKTGGTKAASVLLVGVLAFSAMSCSAPRTISVDAIEPGLIEVLDRHDKYVQADQSLDELLKRIYLRTSELLRLLMEEAKK
jgi:hypothetical protein